MVLDIRVVTETESLTKKAIEAKDMPERYLMNVPLIIDLDKTFQ